MARKVRVFLKTKLTGVMYVCPLCKEKTEYETDSLPVKQECHKCLEPLKYEYIKI